MLTNIITMLSFLHNLITQAVSTNSAKIDLIVNDVRKLQINPTADIVTVELRGVG